MFASLFHFFVFFVSSCNAYSELGILMLCNFMESYRLVLPLHQYCNAFLKDADLPSIHIDIIHVVLLIAVGYAFIVNMGICTHVHV